VDKSTLTLALSLSGRGDGTLIDLDYDSGEGVSNAMNMSNPKRHRIYPPILAAARELRQPQTPAEQKLWARVRDRQLGGFKIRRQHIIDRFIIDFYCADRKLCIEVDGDSHTEPDQIEYDQARTKWLNEEGYRVVRFTNREVFNQIEAVLESILNECNQPSP
jgi:very-short-patch-repair endonuclease